jgi:hypothetical protein
MKELAISVLGLLALIATGFLGATHWMQAGIENEIEQLLASFRPALASATHGPVSVNLWDRSVLIPDLVLIPSGRTGAAATTIASISASGVFSDAGTLTARRITIKDLQSSGPSLGGAAGMTRTEVPEITLDGVTLKHAALTPAGTARTAAASIGAVTAFSVSLPELKRKTVFQPIVGHAEPRQLASVFSTLEQVHAHINVSDVRDGRVGLITSATTTITGTVAGTEPAEFSAEIKDSALSDLDLGMIAGMFGTSDGASASLQDAGTLKTALRHTASGAITLRLDGAVIATLASAEIGAIAVEPARLTAALRAMHAAQPGPGQRATRKQEQAAQDATVSLHEAVAIDRLRISHLDSATPDRTLVKLADLQMHGLQNGKLARLSVAGLDAATPNNDRITAARLSLEGWNLIETIRLSEHTGLSAASGGSALQRPPAVIWPLVLRLLEGIEVEKLTATGHGHRPAVAVAQLYASRGPIVGQIPTSGHLKARFSISVSGVDSATANLFSRHGLGRADIRLDGGWNWQETTKTLTFGPVGGVMADVGALTATFKLTNVSRLALISRPDLMPAAIQAILLGPVDITLRDLGLVNMVSQAPALDAHRLQTIQQYPILVSMIEAPAAPLTALMDGVVRFLKQPGGQLAITLSPKVPLSIGGLLSSGKANDELMPLLASQIDARVMATR